MPSEEVKVQVSQATLNDLYEQLGNSNRGLDDTRLMLEETNKRLNETNINFNERFGMLPCTLHAERIAKTETRLNGDSGRFDRAEARLDGQALHDEDAGKDAHDYRQDHKDRSPSNLYRAVGERIEKRGEEVTERLVMVAKAAAHDAVEKEIEERAAATAARLKQEYEIESSKIKKENDQKLADIELKHKELDLKHKRSMSRVKIFGAIIGAIVASGFFATLKSTFTTEASQVKTEAALKRIEAKQTKIVKPDIGVEP